MPFEGSRSISLTAIGTLLAATAVCSVPGVGAALVTSALAYCEITIARESAALARALEVDVGSAEILYSTRGTFQTGSCCAYAVAVVALVPNGPPPPGVSEAVRWKDASGQMWLTLDGNTDLGTYEYDCRSCGPNQLQEAFDHTPGPGVVVWHRFEDLGGACPD